MEAKSLVTCAGFKLVPTTYLVPSIKDDLVSHSLDFHADLVTRANDKVTCSRHFLRVLPTL